MNIVIEGFDIYCIFIWIFLILFFFYLIFFNINKRKLLKKSQFFLTEDFYIKKKTCRCKSKYNPELVYIFSIMTKDNKYKESIYVNKEIYDKFDISDFFERRDIYGLEGFNKIFVTVFSGQKPDLSGKKELRKIFWYIFGIFCGIFYIFVFLH